MRPETLGDRLGASLRGGWVVWWMCQAPTAPSGLYWRGLARELRTDIRLVKRWRKGARPDSTNLVALFGLAAKMGLLHLLLPVAGSSQDETDVAA